MAAVAAAFAALAFRLVLEHEVLGRQVGGVRSGRAPARARGGGSATAVAGLVSGSMSRDEFAELLARDLLAGLLRRRSGCRARVRRLRSGSTSSIFPEALPRRPARRRVGDDPRAAGAVGRLAFLPLHQHRRGDEDRGVGAGGDADDQREREVLERFAAEQEQRE